MKNFWMYFILAIASIIISFTGLFPIIISVITGNWWYLFLYFVIWVPVSIELFILGLVIKLFG